MDEPVVEQSSPDVAQAQPIPSASFQPAATQVPPPYAPPTVPAPPTYVPPPTPPNSAPMLDKKYLIIGAIILGVILLIGITTRVIAWKNIQSKKGTSQVSGGNLITETSLINAYSKDSDDDLIPDSIETAISLDPNQSEFDRCAVVSCDTNGKVSAANQKNNIMLIIDSSGSMKQAINSSSKMDLAKEAVKKFVQSASSNVSIGIAVYGHKGSNAESAKAVSCASSEVIAPIGSVTSANVDQYLTSIQPTGWTPIGLSINQSIGAFTGKEDEKNQIIVVTDGGETCNTNPEGAATTAQNSASKIQVNVIGFGVTASEYDALRKISSNGGGLFSIAMNSDELLDKMKASRENWKNYASDSSCLNTEYTKSIDCLAGVKKTLNNYFNTLNSTKRGTEARFFSDLGLKISKGYSAKTDALNSEWVKKKQDQQKALGIQ